MNTPTILVVEDDIELSNLIAEILQDVGYQTDIVRDGALVYDHIVKTCPNLVMLDLHLPNVSGVEIVNQIRTNPDLAQMKIIVATADIELGKALRSQVEAVFQKPYSVSEMVELINRLV